MANTDLPGITLNHLVETLDTLLGQASTGDVSAAQAAEERYQALVQSLRSGASLPAHLRPNAGATRAEDITVRELPLDRGNVEVTLTRPTDVEHVDVLVDAEDFLGDGGLFAVPSKDEPVRRVPLGAPSRIRVLLDPAPVDREPDPGDDLRLGPAAGPLPTSRGRTTPGKARPGSTGQVGLDPTVRSTLDEGTFISGFNNPTESHKVAAKMGLKAGKQNHEVFWAIFEAPDGLADFELEALLGRSHQSLSATRNALMNKGYIEASGRLRPTPFGNDANVWVPTPVARQRVAAGIEKRR